MTLHDQISDDALRRAAEARKAGDEAMASSLLREYLLRDRALLWLAKLSSDPDEALAAAELALRLAPGDETVQRAIVAVRERAGALPDSTPSKETIAATITLNTGMTYQEACAVTWPFKRLNRPIGDALADKTICLRDLAYAIEEARDPRLRDAARTVLVTHLVGVEPAQAVRPPKVLRGSRFTERQERRSLLLTGVLVTIGLICCVILVLGSIYSLLTGQSFISWILLLTVAPLAWFSLRQTERLGDEAQDYRVGRWGEESSLDALRNLLTDEWTVVRNLVLPKRVGGDIDLVLVGPGGIWALEVKAYTGTIRNIGDTWERQYKRRWRWRRLHTNPGQQAKRNAARLKEFLVQRGLHVTWVEPAVIWAGDEADSDEAGTLTLQDPAVRVWRTSNLIEDGEDLHQSQRRLTPEQVDGVLAVLRQVVEDTRQEERAKAKPRRASAVRPVR